MSLKKTGLVFLTSQGALEDDSHEASSPRVTFWTASLIRTHFAKLQIFTSLILLNDISRGFVGQKLVYLCRVNVKCTS